VKHSVLAAAAGLTIFGSAAFSATTPVFGDVYIYFSEDPAIFKADSSGGAQMSIPLTVNFVNSNPKAKASALVSFYLSNDTQLDDSDTTLAVKKASGVSILKPKTLKMKFNLPAAAKNKYVVAHAVSPNDTGGILAADDYAWEAIPFNAW
jgi:hypothetical protein